MLSWTFLCESVLTEDSFDGPFPTGEIKLALQASGSEARGSLALAQDEPFDLRRRFVGAGTRRPRVFAEASQFLEDVAITPFANRVDGTVEETAGFPDPVGQSRLDEAEANGEGELFVFSSDHRKVGYDCRAHGDSPVQSAVANTLVATRGSVCPAFFVGSIVNALDVRWVVCPVRVG